MRLGVLGSGVCRVETRVTLVAKTARQLVITYLAQFEYSYPCPWEDAPEFLEVPNWALTTSSPTAFLLRNVNR